MTHDATQTSPPPPLQLNGATRLIPIIGDPIAQVKSPAGVSRSLQDRGLNAIVVPMHVRPAGLGEFMQTLTRVGNVDGVIVTVPHKFAVVEHCATLTERARFLGAANTLRRNADGSWHGDMCDGVGFVRAITQPAASAGIHGGKRPAQTAGARALLVGAGGAGSAIGWALLEAGVRELAVHDADTLRRDALIARLRMALTAGRLVAAADTLITAGTDDPQGYDLVAQASTCGMRADDPMPLRIDRLSPNAFVGDVITSPAITPMIQAARDRGCGTQTGTGMFAAVCELMVEFLLAEGPLAGTS